MSDLTNEMITCHAEQARELAKMRAENEKMRRQNTVLRAACKYVADCTGIALSKEQANTLQKRVRSALDGKDGSY